MNALSQKQLVGLAFVLASLASLMLILSFWTWHQDWSLVHAALPAKDFMTKDNTSHLIDEIPNNHLFGKAFANTNVPITNLQLRVTGIVKIITGDNQNLSKAYISMSGQPSKIYQVSDALPYGVKIYDITQDTVILENNGNLEKLPLPREKLQFKPRETEEHF